MTKEMERTEKENIFKNTDNEKLLSCFKFLIHHNDESNADEYEMVYAEILKRMERKG